MLRGVLKAAGFAAVFVPDCVTRATFPSWETISPMPTPSTIATREVGVVQRGLDRPDQEQGGSKTTTRPSRTSFFRRTGRQRGTSQGGEKKPGRGRQHPHPGVERVEAEHDLRVERDGW